MFNFFYPEPRHNPEYEFYDYVSEINDNFRILSGTSYLPTSGGTVTGNTIFTAPISATSIFTNTLSATSLSALSIFTNTLSANTLSATSMFAGSLSANTLSSGVIMSGSTDLNDIFLLRSGVTGNALMLNSLSSGLVYGCDITINTGNTALIDITPGFGYVVDNWTNINYPQVYNVTFTGVTGQSLTYLSSSTQTHLSISKTGALIQTNVEETNAQRREHIMIGQINHPSFSGINNLNSQVDLVQSPVFQYRDLMSELILINSGNVISANGANLNINKSSGTLFGQGINFQADNTNPHRRTISATTAQSFIYRTMTGGGATSVVLIDPTKYDVGGVITTVGGGSNASTNQRVFLYPNGVVLIQYGQAVYANLAEAISAIQTESFVKFTNVNSSAILIGIISVQKNCTNLSDTTKAKFSQVSKFGEAIGVGGGVSTGTLQLAYNNSVEPEILTNSTLQAVSIKNGSGSDNNNIIEGISSGGTIIFSINGSGNLHLSQLFSDFSFSGANGLIGVDSTGKLFNSNLSFSAITKNWASGSTGNYSIKANNDSGTDATGNYAVAEGRANTATGDASHAGGYSSDATGLHSFAHGLNVLASGAESFAFGNSTTAGGQGSSAGGIGSMSSAGYAHAGGWFSEATAPGSFAHGFYAKSNGSYAHAGGSGVTANGAASFVHGINSIAGGTGTIVLGNYLTGSTDNMVFVDQLNIKTIGTGTSVNNLGVDSSGNIVIGGAGSSGPYITGFTYNNSNQFTIENNTGGTLSATINIMTGLTVNGLLQTTTEYVTGNLYTNNIVPYAAGIINIGSAPYGTNIQGPSTFESLVGTNLTVNNETNLIGNVFSRSGLTATLLIFTGLTDANIYKYTYNESFSAGQLSDLRVDGNTLFSNKVQVGMPTFWSFFRLPSYNTLGIKGGLSIIPNGSNGANTISFHEVNGGSGLNALVSELSVSSVDGTMNYSHNILAPGMSANTMSAGTLNIKYIGSGTPVINLGVDALGNVVTGTTGSGPSSVFTGGTVTGATVFTNGLTANTFSATTFQGVKRQIGMVADGLGAQILTGSTGFSMPYYNGTIQSWYIVGDTTGTTIVDVMRNGASISGTGNTPYITSASANTESVTGWTSTQITAGDQIEYVITSAATFTRINLMINIIEN